MMAGLERTIDVGFRKVKKQSWNMKDIRTSNKSAMNSTKVRFKEL